MSRTVAFPMYAVPSEAAATFWAGLRRHMVAAGLSDLPDRPAVPDDLRAHWRDPNLLLSQTCGYPLVTELAGQVRLVATPCYDAPGCDGPTYTSFVLVRRDDPACVLADLCGRRAACNERGSQSGWNALRAAVAPLAEAGRFFGAVLQTGAHLRSMDAVRRGEADVAAVDCVTVALAARDRPEVVDGLRVLCRTAPGVPGLPLVTGAATSAADIARLRTALHAAAADPALAEARAGLLLRDVAVLAPESYDACLAMERDAVAAGYPDLA